ncbi:MDR family MFS transporter [Streptomyces sp. NPDC001068]|uniref:MDR family MFS transporter n=1 Tax=Streptomyces sp. NPDC001068 TaxID=3364544 RepID=UPI0036BA59DE
MGSIRHTLRETLTGLPGAYWWLWTSTLVNRLGGFVVGFLTLYLTLERGRSATYAGLVASLYGLGGAIGALAGGALADRVGRRRTMLWAQLCAAAATVALALVSGSVPMAVLAASLGAASGAPRPAAQAAMADLVDDEDRVRAFSLNYWAVNIGFAVSSAVAGLIATHGYVWLFLGDAGTTLLCALVVRLRVPETLPAATGSGSGERPGTERPAGVGIVLRDAKFMTLVGLTFLLGLVVQQGSTMLPVDMGRHGLTARDYGTVIALNGVLVVVLQIPLTRLTARRGQAVVLAVGTLLMGWGFGLTALAGSVLAYAGTVAVWTVGEILYAPASMSFVADLAPSHARGRYDGVHTVAWAAASFVGPVLGGSALDHWGSAATWGTCAVIGTLTAAGSRVLLGFRRPAGAATGGRV